MRPMHLTLRPGSSLLELVMALSLTAIIVIAVTGLITRQQRLYRALDASLQALPQRHDASALLGADIRTMLTAVTPTATASDSAFDIAATIGASTTCAASTGVHLWIPPKATDQNATLTAWLSLPDSNDHVLIYRARAATPRWDVYPVASVQTRANSVCTGLRGHFLDAAASEAPAYEVVLATPTTDSIPPGTPLRFVRYGRYNVYKSSDASWYVGYRRCTPAHVCEGVQPLVGPLGTGSTRPATFRFFAANGVTIPPGSSLATLARVDIIVRHVAALVPGLDASASANRPDSVITSIALRNH